MIPEKFSVSYLKICRTYLVLPLSLNHFLLIITHQMQFKMDNIKNLFVIFILISLCQKALCSKSQEVQFPDQDQETSGDNGGCDCDVLEMIDSNHLLSYSNNYTKQLGKLNGRPFYFSVKHFKNQITQGYLPSIFLTNIVCLCNFRL